MTPARPPVPPPSAPDLDRIGRLLVAYREIIDGDYLTDAEADTAVTAAVSMLRELKNCVPSLLALCRRQASALERVSSELDTLIPDLQELRANTDPHDEFRDGRISGKLDMAMHIRVLMEEPTDGD